VRPEDAGFSSAAQVRRSPRSDGLTDADCSGRDVVMMLGADPEAFRSQWFGLGADLTRQRG
jgi:hypothetical protein